MLHPQGASRKERRAAGRAHALARAKARAQATYDKLVAAVAETGKLDRVRAERALTVGVCMLCRAFRQELGSVLGLDAKEASLALQAICKTVAASVTAGELAEVRGQLPKEMRQLFPVAGR